MVLECFSSNPRSLWVPDDSTCFPKFGMFNEITEYFVSNRDDKEGLRLDGDWIVWGQIWLSMV